MLAFQLYRVNLKCQLNKAGDFLKSQVKTDKKCGLNSNLEWLWIWRRAKLSEPTPLVPCKFEQKPALMAPVGYVPNVPRNVISLCSRHVRLLKPLLLTPKMPLYGQYKPLIPDHFYGYQQRGLARPSFTFTLSLLPATCGFFGQRRPKQFEVNQLELKGYCSGK